MSINVGPYLDAARSRLRLHIGVLAVVWIGLVLLMTRIRDIVIGRPIARIKRTMTDAGLSQPPTGETDLDALASNVTASGALPDSGAATPMGTSRCTC